MTEIKASMHVHVFIVYYIQFPLLDVSIAYSWCRKRFFVGREARKLVFGVSEQVMLKSACSATETSWNIEILHVASLFVITFR